MTQQITVATDEVDDVHYQIVKLATGALDSIEGIVSLSEPLPVKAVGVTTPTPANVTLTNANQEYSSALPAHTQKLYFRCRSSGTQGTIRWAWVTGKVAGPTAPYQELPPSAEYQLEGVLLTGATLYLASATAGVVVEIEAWS